MFASARQNRDVPIPINRAARQSFAVERVDARELRKEIIALYARNGKPLFEKLFDWYYRDTGQQTPVSWILRSSRHGGVCGLCSVSTRTFRAGDNILNVGVLGNFLVDEESRRYLCAFDLVRAARSLLDGKGDLDVLVGLPNGQAQPVLLRMGFRVTAHWRLYLQLFRSYQLLQQRCGWVGALASPVVDSLAASRRLLSAWRARMKSDFQIVQLSEEQVDALSTGTWTAPAKSLTAQVTGTFLRWRFLHHPLNNNRIFGIQDKRHGDICGYLAVNSLPGRLHITDCGTHARRISEADAIRLFCERHEARQATVWVTALRESRLSESLSRGGFISPSFVNHLPGSLVALWRPNHPFAVKFSQADRWNVFLGFNDM